MVTTADELRKRMAEIELVVSDVEGTMTKRIYLDYKGKEIKVFCEKDAPRIAAVIKCCIPFVMISGRNSAATRVRAKELKVDFYHRLEMSMSSEDPMKFLEDKYGIHRKKTLYIGDDWGDLWWMSQALVTAAPADAVDEIRSIADIVADSNGGEGAVSEILIELLKVKGLYNRVVADQYLIPSI